MKCGRIKVMMNGPEKTFFCADIITLLSLTIFVLLLHVCDGDRQLTLEVNPNCDIPECKTGENSTSYNNLVYVKSAGEKDTRHYLWSTIGVPTMILVHTSPSASLRINWTNLIKEYSSDAISFSEDVEYFYLVAITNLWEFRDEGDTGKMVPNSNQTKTLHFDDFFWDDVSHTIKNDSSRCTAKFMTMKNESDWIKPDGSFSLEMEAYGSDGRNDIFPRLQYTVDSTQLRVVLNDMNNEFKESRYGLGLLIATSSQNDNKLDLNIYKTIDDEYTPGVFKTAELTSKSGGYLYWKPVVYTSSDLIITDSTDSISYDVVTVNSSFVPYSIASAFSDIHSNSTQFFGTSISFGIEKDGFYEKNHFQAWTVMIGVGNIPQDKVSLMVIVVIAAGLGLPLLVMAIGGIYLLVGKFRKQKDDLLLSRDG